MDLHGNSAQGNDGIRQTAHFLADQIRVGRGKFPFITVFPQAGPGLNWLQPLMQELVLAETDSTIAEFHGDEERVYLSGFSMGATGVYQIAVRWPDKFAALVAVAGEVTIDRRSNALSALAESIGHIPVRVFHGGSDERISVTQSRQLVAALKKIGADVTYTEYTGTGHGPTAERAYAEPSFTRWLLAHRRAAAVR